MAKRAKAKKIGRPSLDASPQQLLRNGHIALRLREEMAKRDWKATDLNEALGSNRDGVIAYRWMSGKGAPSPQFRVKLAKLLGGSPDDFAPRNRDATTPAPTVPFMATTEPTPPKRLQRAAAEVFVFTVNEHGMARIKLDVSLPLAKARPLFNTLLQTGLLPEGGQDDEKQEEAEQ